MKKIDLSHTSTLLANLGVIAGIVFLGVEINQSNALARSQARADIAIAMSEHLSRLSQNSELADLWVRAQSDGLASLDPVEMQRAMNHAGALFRLWENIYYQYRNGLLDPAEYLGERGVMERSLNSRPMSTIFCAARSAISPEFRLEAESLIEGSSCPENE